VWGKGEVYAVLLWGNLKERDHLEGPTVKGRIILRCIFRQLDFEVWTGTSWFSKETGGEHL